MVVFATKMGYLDDKGWEFEHGVLFLHSQMVNIHYHLMYQDNTNNAGDNKHWLPDLIQFKRSLLHLKWVFTDNGSYIKLWLIQSIQIVVFATEMGHIDNKGWDFENGVLFLDSLMVSIHYHLKCQEITDNAGDNKLWLMQPIQMVVFATDMGHLDDNIWDSKHGALSLDSQKVKFIITSNIRILQTIDVIINFDWWNQLKWTFLQLKCVILIATDEISIMVCFH